MSSLLCGVMKRDLYASLVNWRSSSRRKPLLLRGARQTGKTFLLQEFGRREYERVIYCNFEEDPALAGFFERDLTPARIVDELGIYFAHTIRPGSDLIIFDEVQMVNRALNSLKYFQEKANAYHVAAAGSLVGVKLSLPGSFPVGKVNFLDLYPMNFLEFLDAVDAGRYRVMLQELESPEPLAEAFHADLIDLLRKYYVVGGMPEAVQQFVKSGDIREVREVQREIMDSYVLDFAKHAPPEEIPKLTRIWESIPRHLARENKKFVFSVVRQGARAREYESALKWIEDAGLVHLCHAIETNKQPLAHYAAPNCFKVYVLDVGLLGAMVRAPADLMVQGERLFNEYEGAFVENYVAQQLICSFQDKLYYWRSKGGKAEVDFLCEFQGETVPLEAKAGVNPKSKSLRSFDRQFGPSGLFRTSLLNLRRDGKVCNVPLYAVSQIPRFAVQ